MAAMSKRSWKRDPGLWIAVMVIAVLVIGGVVKGTPFGGGESEPDAVGAQVACQDRVEKLLKAPGSADFNDVTATVAGPNTWTVTGTVDADNSFGASLRSTFTCKAESDDGETWTTSRVRLS